MIKFIILGQASFWCLNVVLWLPRFEELKLLYFFKRLVSLVELLHLPSLLVVDLRNEANSALSCIGLAVCWRIQTSRRVCHTHLSLKPRQRHSLNIFFAQVIDTCLRRWNCLPGSVSWLSKFITFIWTNFATAGLSTFLSLGALVSEKRWSPPLLLHLFRLAFSAGLISLQYIFVLAL